MEEESLEGGLRGKVLIVDDAPDTLEIIQKLLAFEGYEILTAQSGEEALKKAETEKPEVVLLDINLPGIDGNEVLRRIRQLDPIVSVIMLTAFATVDNAIHALQEGASDFIKKPFENDHLIHMVNQCMEKYWTLKEKGRLEEEVKRLSITDDLTNLFNYRHFYKTLELEITRLKRQKTSLSLLMFDMDNFKRYNDLYGHLEGDKVLKKVGEIVMRLIRNNVDSGYRYGGDEFAVLLIGATLDQAMPIAERLRVSIEQAGFQDISVSIGVTEFHPDYTLREFVRLTDDCLYAAKNSGGNRVYAHIR
jgi:two-component system cell cycle response regulator